MFQCANTSQGVSYIHKGCPYLKEIHEISMMCIPQLHLVVALVKFHAGITKTQLIQSQSPTTFVMADARFPPHS